MSKAGIEYVFVGVCFMCMLSVLVVASNNMPDQEVTPEEFCSCNGRGPDCELAIFQVDDDRKAYCALWTRKTGTKPTGCCMVDAK